MKQKQIYYFSNEQTDEVVDFNVEKLKIDKNYKYERKNLLYKMFSFITYRIFATPAVWFYYKVLKRIKFVNKKILKEHKKGGYFIFANHTMKYGDGFCPALICFPKRPSVIVNADNVSIPFLGKFLQMWGALPLPDTLSATKNFYSAIEHSLLKNNPVIIYPEAHLWPYYTKIRPFPSLAFRYPIKYNKPVYSFTTVYKLKKQNKKPKIEIYIDGPFYHDINIPQKQAQEKLKNEVYKTMQERSKLSDYQYVKYIKRSNND